MMKKVLALALIGLGVTVSNAEQIFQASTGQNINATISAKDFTRIQVSGVRIAKAFTSSLVTIKKDSATGQLYVMPNGAKGTFSLFITDINGDTFNLLLSPSKNKDGDSIVIMPDKASLKRTLVSSSNKKSSSSYERGIMSLTQIMFLSLTEDDNIGYQVVDNNTEIPMWKKMKVILTKTYSNQILNGYILEVTNNGSDPVLLNEAEFYKNGVLAVAIDKPSIEVGGSTKVFIIQENTTK